MARGRLLAGGAILVSAVLATVYLARPAHAIASGLAYLRGAEPAFLVAAGLAFLAAGIASAAAWHRALAACGAQLERWQVIRRYAAGSFANTLAPTNAGEVVRVALIARAIGSEGAAFTTIGVAAAVSVVRAVLIAALFFVAVPHGHLLPWLAPVAVAAAVVTVIALGGVWGRRGTGRLGHLLDVVRAAAASPGAALESCTWIAAAIVSRVLASACIGAALGLHHPLAAALVIVPVLELAGVLQLTPGNIGVTSAAVALALRGHGVPLAPAIGTGIALHAVETIVGLTFGGACALSLAPRLRPRVGRVLIASTAAALVIAVATSSVVGAAPELA